MRFGILAGTFFGRSAAAIILVLAGADFDAMQEIGFADHTDDLAILGGDGQAGDVPGRHQLGDVLDGHVGPCGHDIGCHDILRFHRLPLRGWLLKSAMVNRRRLVRVDADQQLFRDCRGGGPVAWDGSSPP